MSQWIDAKATLPPFKKVVLVRRPSGYDGSNVISFGARVDGEDENGRPAWVWGVGGRFGVNPEKDADYNDIECDDEYPVTHWMPIVTFSAGKSEG